MNDLRYAQVEISVTGEIHPLPMLQILQVLCCAKRRNVWFTRDSNEVKNVI